MKTEHATFSITTDLAGQNEDMARVFPAFGAAGFSAVHWCQDWTGQPVFYDRPFAERVGRLARANGLRVADVHGFGGTGETGIPFTDELFAAIHVNRAEFAARLGANVLVLHLPPRPHDDVDRALPDALAAVAALVPPCKPLGVRLAVENLVGPVHVPRFFDTLLAQFPPDELGFCYDSGHALLAGQADLLARYADRLIATHLHDNDGTADQHRLPGQGLCDWPTILAALDRPDYPGTVNLEVRLPEATDLADFCKTAYRTLRERWDARRRLG